MSIVSAKRDSITILADILKSLDGYKKSRKMSIVYKSNLNFIRIGKYLDILITAGMVEATTENESRLYSITERGREFLHTYERLRQALRTPALPAPGNILLA